MSLPFRTLASFSLAVLATPAFAADSQPAGTEAPAATVTSVDDLEFAGVMGVGGKTMVSLIDKQSKKSFWVETGTTSAGVTVVKYDAAKDEVTVRVNGTEKVLPLRAGTGVVNGPSAQAGQPAQSGATAPATAPQTLTPISQLSPARQEEEARMLVSDLLEIGMAQRKAYEEAQRRAASGQPAQPAQPAAAQASTQPAPVQPTQPAQTAPSAENSQQAAQ